MQEIRGKIHTRARARQLRDFSSLRYGNITATDVDGLIEYHDRGYIILELKLNNIPLPYGQKLALERLTDDLNRASKVTICIIASHHVSDPNDDIDAANCCVIEYRFKGKWQSPPRYCTVKEFTRDFIAKYLV